MARILLAWELGAGTGHCVNLMPIAEQLVNAGHEVNFIARDLATAKRIFGSLAVGFLQAPFLVSGVRRPVRRPQTFAEILHNVGFGDGEKLAVLTQAWRRLIEYVEPMAIVCEHAPTALLASRWFSLKRFVLGTGFFSPPDSCPWPNIRPGAPTTVSASAQACEQGILERINVLLNHDRLSMLESAGKLYSEVDATYLTTFQELDHYTTRGSADYCGMWAPARGAIPDWPAQRPRVFAYLNPPSNFWPLSNALRRLRESSFSIVAYVPGVDRERLTSLESATLTFANEPLDMASIAHDCDAAIHNGSAGTAATLLLSGIPQLLIPLHLEQAVFSQRVVELGAGLALRPDHTDFLPEKLAAICQGSSFKAEAQTFADRYADYSPLENQRRICSQILHGV